MLPAYLQTILGVKFNVLPVVKLSLKTDDNRLVGPVLSLQKSTPRWPID